MIHRLLRRKRDHCFSPCVPADIKALAHGSRCFYGFVRFPCHSTIRLPFPDFPCFYYVPYIDVRYQEFFSFLGSFFKICGTSILCWLNRQNSPSVSPSAAATGSDRHFPPAIPVFRKIPPKKARTLRSWAFVYVGFYAGFKR